jgi:colanic acid/amylovoran biosynthesis glycosyltransferase
VRILTVARLAEKKGIEYSIRAIAQVIQKHPDWEIKYRIAGDGPLRSELQDLIDHLDARHQVKLVGWMDQAEIQDLYASSHLFVLASVTAKNGDQEGQGLVLAEAQAAGLPVVCTDHNGFSESIIDHKSGFLVPERDVDSLAEKIEFLIANPQVWSDMATEGRQYIEKNYALYNLNRQLIDLYDTLLAE